MGPRPVDDLFRRAAGGVSAGDPRWRFRNDCDSAVVLDVPGHEVSLIEPGREVAFISDGGTLLAVADPERPDVVLALGPVAELAEPGL